MESNTQTIGNNYGAACTAKAIVERYQGEKGFGKALESSSPNLAMRMFLASFGFNRVSRPFTEEVLRIARSN